MQDGWGAGGWAIATLAAIAKAKRVRLYMDQDLRLGGWQTVADRPGRGEHHNIGSTAVNADQN
jgi:hypothetical protein